MHLVEDSGGFMVGWVQVRFSCSRWIEGRLV